MIYILHVNIKESVKMLDDRSLDRQIKYIAQALCDEFPCCSCDVNSGIYKRIIPTWTRREKPEFLL